jgi:sugar O-acyltransferase (sialic acid O-acetyltransferase NeuD family)
MKKIAIYGAGGLGKEVAWMLEEINQANPTWELIGFFDDRKLKGEKISFNKNVLGGISELNEWKEELAITLAFGNPNTISLIKSKIINTNVYFSNLIHPILWCASMKSNIIGIGNIIMGGCIFSCDTIIGDFNLFNGLVCLGHDVKIGSCNVFMPAVRISGEVAIGDRNLFGVSSIVLQQLKIEEGVVLSPGSVLLHKPKNNSTYIGNPARLLRY